MSFSPFSSVTVDLWAARLPRLARFAEHCWFVVESDRRIDRWEVWQGADLGGESWGHLHRNLLAPTAGIRGNQAYWIRRWTDQEALAIAARIESSPQHYPWCRTYHYVPGPNSNTFVQWCLGDRHRLGWRSIGRGFAGKNPAETV